MVLHVVLKPRAAHCCRGKTMNVIILSGGSGKRLWPLSNEIRSKQFIRLLKDENGEYESMAQRVIRQLTTVDPEVQITIATSKSQVSTIRSQLGEKVAVCVEPSRRDTFPAIALAAAYLHDELGVDESECVVVCPVDPFVEIEYYQSVKALESLVKEDRAKLTLLGVEPTYPSDKYGYIIPGDSGPISEVKEFCEKPDTWKAKEYLAQDALWNSGVFAFRLKYMIDKLHEMTSYTDYRDLYAKFDSLPCISFDYAVAEKEPSCQVVRYSGEWKDIGTWNMMAEVMADVTKGNVMLDDTCTNTQVVNELDVPILCMGCKDMVIAASCDGILVTDKEQSGYMKPYVEKIKEQARYIEKSWGTYAVIDMQPGSLTVKVSLTAGNQMKYHSHEQRDEVWNILSGQGRCVVDGMEQIVRPGDVISVAAGCRHTLIAETDMSVIEVQIGTEISQKDKKVWNQCY